MTDYQIFRKSVKDFLGEALTPELRRAGELTTSVFSEFSAALAWQKKLHAQGWIAPDWPSEFGGPGWDIQQRSIFQEECKLANAPSVVMMGIQMLGPMLMHYGTEEQKQYYLPRMLSGADIWCQGYSEPGAGSDLASLKTTAVRDGDNYVVNGTKIWTSMAHHANQIFCLVRTDKAVKPQAGISFLLIDLESPGITITPIVSLDGQVEQCQVFFDAVKVPCANLVGAENDGWSVAKSCSNWNAADTISPLMLKNSCVKFIAKPNSRHGVKKPAQQILFSNIALLRPKLMLWRWNTLNSELRALLRPEAIRVPCPP